MYNTIKFSTFLLVVILVGKVHVANGTQDSAPLADDVQTQHKELDHAKPQSRLKPAYLIVNHTVSNVESYTKQYAMPVVGQLQDIGAKVLAVSSEPKFLEGKWEHKSTVIIEFPSMSVAEKWYSSEAYKPYKDLRVNKLTEKGNLVLVPAH